MVTVVKMAISFCEERCDEYPKVSLKITRLPLWHKFSIVDYKHICQHIGAFAHVESSGASSDWYPVCGGNWSCCASCTKKNPLAPSSSQWLQQYSAQLLLLTLHHATTRTKKKLRSPHSWFLLLLHIAVYYYLNFIVAAPKRTPGIIFQQKIWKLDTLS